MSRYYTFLIFILFISLNVNAQEPDTTKLKHWGAEVNFTIGEVLGMDKKVKKWLKDKGTFSISGEMRYTPLPQDKDDFASDYKYPTMSVGLRYGNYEKVTMHKDPSADWGMAQTVDYYSRLGNNLTLYGKFSRPIFRHRHWQVDYMMTTGIGWGLHPYNRNFNIDNEMIGSRWLIYFGAGVNATYYISPQWGIKAGIEYSHHSNGGLDRPNKGSNAIGPSLALIYSPNDTYLEETGVYKASRQFDKKWYSEISLGFGGKALQEEWDYAQYSKTIDDPEYRKNNYAVYAALSAQIDFMYRYARRWASGPCIDLFYGTYANRLEHIGNLSGKRNKQQDPFSIAVGGKHEVFYHNTSLRVGLAFYLYRDMGFHEKEYDKPYYEWIGVHQSFPKLGGLKVGIDVKAHLGKADLTQITVGYPIYFKKNN